LSPAGFFLEPLFERASDPAFVIDPLEDRFLAANTAGCDLLGYTRKELLETPVSRIHPGEIEQLQAFVGTVLGRGHGSTIALTCRISQGTRVPIKMSLSAFESDDRVLVLGLVHDRSEHRGRRAGDSAATQRPDRDRCECDWTKSS
jgi:two-component system, chemotaxis family, sensor kinase Cph1